MWRKLEPDYPTLARMAQDVFAIPAASVGVERTFSIARHQQRFNRKYSPSTFTAILVARHHLASTTLEAIEAESYTEVWNEEGEEALNTYRETIEEVEEAFGLGNISDTDEDNIHQSNSHRNLLQVPTTRRRAGLAVRKDIWDVPT